MPSIKQLEAFYWSGKLGSFIATSRHLNTTQSNVSKRIQELEDKLQLKLFDRSKRSIRMTAEGQELMVMSENILKIHGEIASLGHGPAMFRGILRFGVVGSVATTWLPILIATIKERYPGILLRTEVRGSRTLHSHLRNREIDFIIGTRPLSYMADFTVIPLTSLELVWVSSPAIYSSKNEISLEQLFKMPVISHLPESAGQRILEDLLVKVGVTPNYVITCNSLSALAALVTAGLGITFLPKHLVAEEIQSGNLHEINVVPPLPPNPYVAMINKDEIRPLPAQIVKIAQEVCDFSRRASPRSVFIAGQDNSVPTKV